MNFGLTDRQFSLLQELLSRHLPGEAEVIVYGSRAKGTHNPGSDLDFVIKGIPDRHLLATLREQIDDSDFPLLCDVQFYEEIRNPSLKDHIDRRGRTMNEPSAHSAP